MIDARQIAEALGGRKSARGYMCKCVSHEDKSPSLHITDGENGRPVVHCFAGCEFHDIAKELEVMGLWPKNENEEEGRRKWAQKKAAEEYSHAKLIVALAMGKIMHGETLTQQDRKSLNKSKQIVKKLGKKNGA